MSEEHYKETQTIRVIVNEPNGTPMIPEEEEAPAPLEELLKGALGRASAKIVEIQTTHLAQNLADTYKKILSALSALPQIDSAYTIQQVTFTLLVDSTANVSLLSAISTSAQAEAGITFTLIKHEAQHAAVPPS